MYVRMSSVDALNVTFSVSLEATLADSGKAATSPTPLHVKTGWDFWNNSTVPSDSTRYYTIIRYKIQNLLTYILTYLLTYLQTKTELDILTQAKVWARALQL